MTESAQAAESFYDESFNTHEYVKKLTDVGVPEPQAEVFAKARATDLKDSAAIDESFNTHDYIKEMTDAGVSKPQAEVIAKARATDLKARAAARDDLEAYERKLKANSNA